jgi:hypothetical protein
VVVRAREIRSDKEILILKTASSGLSYTLDPKTEIGALSFEI